MDLCLEARGRACADFGGTLCDGERIERAL
jgi:hypothetical protein